MAESLDRRAGDGTDQLLLYARDLVRTANAERELSESLAAALRGTIEVLAELLSLIHPSVFGRAARLQCYVQAIVKELGLDQAWQYETAALLSQIGRVSIPIEIQQRAQTGQSLTEAERRMLDSHLRVARDLLARVPRFDGIACIVDELDRRSNRSRVGESRERDDRDQEAPPETPRGQLEIDPELGARILDVVEKFDGLICTGQTASGAVDCLMEDSSADEREILEVLRQARVGCTAATSRKVAIGRLQLDMVLEEDLRTTDGKLLMAHGNKITGATLERLRNWHVMEMIPDAIRVLVTDARWGLSPITV